MLVDLGLDRQSQVVEPGLLLHELLVFHFVLLQLHEGTFQAPVLAFQFFLRSAMFALRKSLAAAFDTRPGAKIFVPGAVFRHTTGLKPNDALLAHKKNFEVAAPCGLPQ